MRVLLLFAATVLIWGSTWIVVQWHLGVVEPGVSAFYRNTLAALILFAWCWKSKLALRFPLKDHINFLLLGLFLFSSNYWLVYRATGFMTSGLVAVVFSTIVFFNMFNARLILKYPVRLVMVLGAGLGVSGIFLLFYGELAEFSWRDNSVRGFALAFLATILASLGSITATYLSSHRQLPVIQYNAWGMFYGCIILFLAALFGGNTFNYEATWQYSSALLYLGVVGTAAGFACYLKLIEIIGPGKAGYTFVMFPVVALIISTAFEGYQWSATAFCGLALVLLGSFLALRTKPVLADSV